MTSFRYGAPLNIKTFEKERKKIEKIVKKNEFPEFSRKNVTFVVDTTLVNHQYAIEAVVSLSAPKPMQN